MEMIRSGIRLAACGAGLAALPPDNYRRQWAAALAQTIDPARTTQ
jgi:hypothetical protein